MNNKLSTLELLQHSPLGSVLDDHHLEEIGQIAVRVHEPAGAVLFREGAPAIALWLVCSGGVALDIKVPLREPVRVLTLGPRDLLGWSSMVGDGSMSTKATITEEAELLRFPAKKLKDLCIADHTLGYALMGFVARAIANRLRGTRLQFLDLYAETEPSATEGTTG